MVIKVFNKCQICGRANSTVDWYEGYHVYLCSDCFTKTKHEALLELRIKYYKNQGDQWDS